MAADSIVGQLLDPEREVFARAFIRLLDTALASGIRGAPFRDGPPERGFMGYQHQKRFISGCHRGYDRAQTTVLETVSALCGTELMLREESEYRLSVLRKVSDAIAIAMLNMKDHVMARMCTGYDIHSLDIPVIAAASKDVQRMNSESRKTFALLADLTTFVHVCDVLRIDFRKRPARVQMIELKSGRVNEVLLSELEKYAPTSDSLAGIDADPAIEERHKPQAKRMLRQAIRRDQVRDILRDDEGTDPVSGQHLKLSKVEVTLEEYGRLVEGACAEARESGQASTSVDACLHVGVGHSPDTQVAAALANKALARQAAEHYLARTPALTSVLEEVAALVPEDELVTVVDPLHLNLYAVPTRPFPLWGLDKSTLVSLLSGTTAIRLGFDLPAFFCICREMGVEVGLSTRRAAAERNQLMGGKGSKTWGHRLITYKSCDGPVLVGERNLLRWLSDWYRPADFVEKAWLPHLKGPVH